ncbi:MAG: cellulase family glycosylhydrolase [Candidatus Marinimicrobia bacterium]|nr:cellulase family glycosylhydrolase [Candidatus Neomarinimicrobiota bacterium]
MVIIVIPVHAFVHASGQNIVDADGIQVLRKGMGLGGWLVPEGYMLHTPGMGSPTSIRAQIVDVVGESVADEFYAAYHANYVTRADIAELAEWGFDHVRMPFHYNMFSPYRGVWNEWGFEVTDSLVAWCSAVGMHVVLDMHCAPGGQNGGPISDSDGTARLWLADTNKTHTMMIWEAIATRYADEPWIGGYDLLNEPVLPDGVTSQAFKNLYLDIATVIRAVDNNHILFIEGNWYATDFTGLTPPFDDNMAYSFHKYWSTNNLGSIASYLSMRNNFNVPLWMSETGENSNPWFHEAVELFEATNVGWCWWTTKKIDTITSPYSIPRPAAYDQLISYWDTGQNKPSASVAEAILMELAENIRTEHCSFRPGVVASLFDPDYGIQSKPFKTLKIPGTILCADYDIGNQGIAYSDLVYQTVHWDDYTAWNNGYQYRNDGVDIELDPQGTPIVGWTSDGEWLRYSFSAEEGGSYSLGLEVASLTSSGYVRLYIDGELIRSITETPITGGWQNWSILLVEDIPISIGSHKLTLEILQAGINLRTMEFSLDSSDTGIETANNFSLGQNYPNPFNGGTKIQVSTLTDEPLTIEILDLSGSIVKTFTVDKQSGVKYLDWSGIDVDGKFVPAGAYLYRARTSNDQLVKKMIFLP